MPGVHRSLRALRAAGTATLGLLTGNYAAAIPPKLRAVDIAPEWFEVTAFGDEARSRRDLAALAIARYSLRAGATVDPRWVVVVGDTPRDVDCARAHGCFALAVGTGSHDEAALAAAGADLVVADLEDPTPLLLTVERRARAAA